MSIRSHTIAAGIAVPIVWTISTVIGLEFIAELLRWIAGVFLPSRFAPGNGLLSTLLNYFLASLPITIGVIAAAQSLWHGVAWRPVAIALAVTAVLVGGVVVLDIVLAHPARLGWNAKDLYAFAPIVGAVIPPLMVARGLWKDDL